MLEFIPAASVYTVRLRLLLNPLKYKALSSSCIHQILPPHSSIYSPAMQKMQIFSLDAPMHVQC